MVKRATKRQKKTKLKAQPLAGSTVKMSLRKHLLPPLAGLLTGVGILLLLNTQILIGKASQLTYQAPAAVAQEDKKTAAAPKPNPNAPAQIIINGIRVKAPVIYNQKTINEANFQLALRDGVVHYPNTAFPGKKGNVVIFGHSSGQVWAPGNYKFVFTHLDKLNLGDKIFLDYQGTRYTYTVGGKKVVPPSDVSVLDPTEKNILTLITCTPVGTSKDRLIITARQTSPDPKPDKKPEATPPQLTEQGELPSSDSPSLWDSIKEIF